MMAPTEILIEQHKKNFEAWLKGMNIPSVVLTGSLSTPEKRNALEQIKSTSPMMIFGTHALFESSVEFRNLGLVIVDEQHRFGVRQRAALVAKGLKPDLLVMTATPIPRTLALTLYGDLDVSVIDELPPGRKPIETRVFTDRQRITLNKDILKQLEAGRQIYIVFPLIEESEVLKLKSIEQMFPSLQKAFKPFVVSHLHGRMKSDEKSQILSDFKSNKIQVLVSTTVVEVGVDIPNATVMVIENAERFGLSQLHQLRGRVGRGAEQSYCYLVASHLGTPEIVSRLRGMERIHDGFKLSELDLEMRGPGEFLGTRQSGLPAFQLARLPRDLNLLQTARNDAFEWIQKDPELKKLPEMKRRLQIAELIHLN
jgi:ATP-dependent DNA helicase RecG